MRTMSGPAAGSVKQRGFPADRTARLIELEGQHFWFVARRHLIARLVERHVPVGGTVLDVGCGSAALADRIAERRRVIGIDQSAVGLKALPARSGALFKLHADATRLPMRPCC